MKQQNPSISKEQVEAALNEIRPLLAMDGGNIECVAIDGGTVKVRLLGACSGCPMAAMTMQFLVEQEVKERIPGVAQVVRVSD